MGGDTGRRRWNPFAIDDARDHRRQSPETVGRERKALAEVYANISDSNFSHEVLAARPQDLAVMRVSDVGWSDLGEPARVLATLAHLGVQSQLALSAG